MKIYISADIEGICGVTAWDEAEKDKPFSSEFREQMSNEVAAACEGVLEAGADEVWVKDAHETGRNILARNLPESVYLIKGWSGHPLSMVQELDNSFSAVMMIGYHSGVNSAQSPLSHTMSLEAISVKINDRYASEFLIHAYAAAYSGIPVIFLSGDDGICKEAQTVIPEISTVSVKRGIGNAMVSIHPKRAIKQIKEKVSTAIKSDLNRCRLKLPSRFAAEITYRNHTNAYKFEFYPGCKRLDDRTLLFETNDYFEVLRFFHFTL